MSDHDEVADGMALSHEQAKKLYVIDPNHELLKYITQPDNDEVWEEFMGRFGKPGLDKEHRGNYMAMAYVYAKYFIALREACEDPEKEIVVSHDNQG